jgi:hypothetical protein
MSVDRLARALPAFLEPDRERRRPIEQRPEDVRATLPEGTCRANAIARADMEAILHHSTGRTTPC